jgi:hypothetical protein
MSKSQDDYKVGYKRPPVGKPFGPGNQAARGRRKRRPGKSQMMEGVRDALLQEIPVQQQGKQRRVPLGYMIGKKMVQQLAQAPLPQMVKAWGDLKKTGLLELFEGEAQLDEQWAELELEKREFARLRHSMKLLDDITREDAERDRINLHVAFQMLSHFKERHDCAEFEGKFLKRYEQLREIVVSPEEAEELASSLSVRELLSSEDLPLEEDQPDDHDLRKGMLGSD